MKYLFLSFVFSIQVLANHAVEIEPQEPARPAKEVKKEEKKAPKTPEEFLRNEVGDEQYNQILDVIAQTNAERQKHGLSPVKINFKLMYAAREQAWAMANNNTLSHRADNTTMGQRIRKEGYVPSAAGENIGRNNTHTQIVGDWMSSEGHKANILGPYKEIGVYRVFSKTGVPYWAQVFGTSF